MFLQGVFGMQSWLESDLICDTYNNPKLFLFYTWVKSLAFILWLLHIIEQQVFVIQQQVKNKSTFTFAGRRGNHLLEAHSETLIEDNILNKECNVEQTIGNVGIQRLYYYSGK